MASKRALPVKITPELKSRIEAIKSASKPQITSTAIVEYCLTLGLPVLEKRYNVPTPSTRVNATGGGA